jgi:hypothetical protein
MELSEAMRTQNACRYYRDEPELLGIPGRFSTACHITAGYPARPFPRKLHRPDPATLAFADKFGVSLGSS